jgi:histidinol-phosphatase (PHP family)
MVLDTDFHNHVVRSSALQMVESAKAKGLHVLGLSEHDFQMNEVYPLLTHMPLEGPRLSIHDYFEQVHSAAKQVQFDVRLGLEVDFIPEKQEQIEATLRDQAWDYLIGSVHQIGDNQFESARPATVEEGEALWLRYFRLLRAAVNTQFFNVISHPVRMRSENPYLPAALDSELEQLASEAARNNVALEINGYDMLTYPEVVSRLVRACNLYNTPISVGSDAHGPHQIAQAHVQTEKLLREVGINKVRIWKDRISEEYTI